MDTLLRFDHVDSNCGFPIFIRLLVSRYVFIPICIDMNRYEQTTHTKKKKKTSRIAFFRSRVDNALRAGSAAKVHAIFCLPRYGKPARPRYEIR